MQFNVVPRTSILGRGYYCISGGKVTTTFVYTNINSPFIYKSRGEITVWERERERERESWSGTPRIYTKLRQTYSELIFFVLLSRKADTGQASQLATVTATAGIAPKTADWILSLSLLTKHRFRLIADVGNFHHNIFFWRPHISFQAMHVAFQLSLVYLKKQLDILFLKSIRTGQPKVNM